MKHGKKYQDSAKSFDPAEAATIPGKAIAARTCTPPRPSSTRPSKYPSAWASTPATPTSRSAAAVVLPHGTGKTVRVLVFAKGDKAKEARGGRR